MRMDKIKGDRMKGPFEIIKTGIGNTKEKPGIGIGIRVKIGEHETLFPISGICDCYEAMEAEARLLKENIEEILRISKPILTKSEPVIPEISPDMEPEEIWGILSSVDEESLFFDSFNRMEEKKRKEVADHILSKCNIFTGKGAVFSSRYDQESGLLTRD